MNRIPPEVDRLMWAVAENPTSQAIDEFASRYPGHRLELTRRVNMVQGLRSQMKVPASPLSPIPRFEPRQLPKPSFLRTYGVALAVGAAALAVAGTMYATMTRPIAPTRSLEVNSDLPLEVPKVTYVTPQTPTYSPPPVQPNPEPRLPDEPAPNREPSYLTPRERVAFKDVSLANALKLITSGTGMNLVIGPGFVDQKISLEYRNKSTVEILRDMAKQYAFTISDEGEGNFLALPVPDTYAPLNADTNTRRIGP